MPYQSAALGGQARELTDCFPAHNPQVTLPSAERRGPAIHGLPGSHPGSFHSGLVLMHIPLPEPAAGTTKPAASRSWVWLQSPGIIRKPRASGLRSRRQTVTSTLVTLPYSAETLRSARAPPGASTRSLQVPGAAKKRNPPSSPSGTSATNSSPVPSSRAYPVDTGALSRTTRPSTTAWLPASVATATGTPPAD